MSATGDQTHYVEYLERENATLTDRADDLESQLARAEAMLERYERWGVEALSALDQAVARLLAEEHGPPPTPFRRSPR
jgi:hypothetical protein